MKINPSKAIAELITALSYAADIEDNKKNFHAWKVAIFSTLLCERLAPKEIKPVFYASLLHDIGGVGFPLHIIHYLSRHDKKSQNILLSHPIIGAQLTSTIPKLNASAKLILDHHEWIDGHGYPRAKVGKEIPLGSQIIRIADSLDILLQTSRNPGLSKIKEKMSLTINKEYSKKLYSALFSILNSNKILTKASEKKNIPGIFSRIRQGVGYKYMPLKLDAVGKTLEVVAQVADMKHPYTYGHSLRVAHYAVRIAAGLHLPHDDITRIKWASLVHDIGKISISRKILDKPEGLNEKEFRKVKRHADITEEIIEMVPSLTNVVSVAAGHHEYFDGSGYPKGLAGERIPLETRIITVCDAFDAMTSNRPYRDALSKEVACREIEKMSGKQFDPQIVKIALPFFRNLA